MVALANETRKTASMTDPDVEYDLMLDSEGVPVACSCGNWQFVKRFSNQPCKHMKGFVQVAARKSLIKWLRNFALSTSGVNQVRGKDLVTVCWYELSEAEKRAANDQMNDYNRVA